MNWHFRNISIYPRNKSAKLDPKLFRNPTAEYRAAPFWSWNTRLDRETLFRQIDALREMGMGGFHIHSRTGLATPYLGDEFMQRVRECVLRAEELKMTAWLYDEDRWPSGFAGGLVTSDHSLRARHLLWTAVPYGAKASAQSQDSAARGSRRENGRLLARYEVQLKDGYLKSYRRLDEQDKPRRGATLWYAYLEFASESSWFNKQAYVDTLNPRAIQRFVQVTHERYAEAVGDWFGSVIPSIFTDEPQFTHKGQLNQADELRDICMPFTDDFFETFAKSYKQRLEELLPELFWELPDGRVSVARYRYHDHVAERFAAAFADTCGKWCIDHQIALTGHMMHESTLQSQTGALGEAMRSYRAFQLPGIDMLCDWQEYTTAKQAQSAAHQYGRPGVVSELYGVTNWDFSFVGHKAQGDWQAALGVSVRVPHLAWVSMAGEAKRDYPAPIDYHSPWYAQYPLIEDHFARVNVAMTRGKPVVRVGVVHPVESYWLAFGPMQQTKLAREEQERAFSDVTNWLLFGMVDFNYISESLLPELNCRQNGRKFKVGQMAYDAVIVPSLRTIRSTTLDRLEAFAKVGGKVIFAGPVPTLVDAQPSGRPMQLARRCCQVRLSRGPLMEALEGVREVDVRTSEGGRADSVIYQMRQDGRDRLLFLVQSDRRKGRAGCRIRVRGHWHPRRLDTFSGEIRPIACEYESGWTAVPFDFTAHGHLLMTLSPGRAPLVKQEPGPQYAEIGRLADPIAITLSEPNVLLLDQCQWRIGESGEWQPLEEVLRVDNLVRKTFGLSARGGQIAQPWVEPAEDPVMGTVQLRFVIRSEIDVSGAAVALEDAAFATISLDGRPVTVTPGGWWVDEAIQKVALPEFSAGEHELVVSYRFARKRNIEWMYVLGDFGVRVNGRHATIIAPVRNLTFGDFTQQGLPFYAGNVTYHCTLQGGGKALRLESPRFSSPLLSVTMDGEPAGRIAFAPFALELGKLPVGEHRLDITAYGNRMNAFGQVHLFVEDPGWKWFGPQSWRTIGAEWSYEYQLKRMGVLAAPLISEARN